jgi:hypothetical protein
MRQQIHEAIDTAMEDGHLQQLAEMVSIPLGIAHLCANCSAIHNHRYCPACGDTNFELVEKFMPKSTTTWKEEQEFYSRQKKLALSRQEATR